MVVAVPTAHAEDAYIESVQQANTSGISTGYRMKGTSRVEVDFALATTDSCAQWRIFGSDAQESSLMTYMYIDGSSQYTLIVKPNGMSRYTTYVADTQRHTAVIDLYHSGLHFITAGVTNWTTTAETSFSGREADLPLSIFGRYSNAYANKFELCAKARIYGVKIYENDVPVHDFVPCLKEGVACFKDIIGGGFITGEDVAKFTAGGDVPTYDDDCYVSTAANASGSKLYIDTGYKVSDKTAVAIDCSFSVNTNLAASPWSMFDCNGGTRFNINFNRWYGLRFCAGGNSDVTTLAAAFGAPEDDKDVRRTFVLDNLNTFVAGVTSGFTNKTASFTVSTSSIANGTTLKLASDPWANGSYAALKIYGCKIWEGGVLVRDFVPYVDNGIPGMRDNLTGMFAAGKDASSGGDMLAYGGSIGGEQDAYLQSAGSANISTGYKMNGNSRVEVDFALTTTNSCEQWRIFGTDGDTSFKTWLYLDGDAHYSMVTPWGQKYTTHTADTIRHTAIIDVNHGWSGLVTGSTTNWSMTTSDSYAGQEADYALPLFGRNYCFAKERIYSVRIYESDVLVHEFIPYDGRGDVAGFYDTVTGEVVSNGSSFTFGGAGQDHGQLKAYIKPGYAKQIYSNATTTLTAYAPGATSYRWLMDGEPVAGGTDGVFNVSWARGGTETEQGYRHTYQAIAVFEDFYGVTRESEPTAAAEVTSLPRGLAIRVY